MTIKKLTELTEDMNDCLTAMVTHLTRLEILCEKMGVNPKYRQEYGEFMIDWGVNITKFGNLSVERTELMKEMTTDGHNKTTT